jgi:hypothetical protein
MHSGYTGFCFGNLDAAGMLARSEPLTCGVVDR